MKRLWVFLRNNIHFMNVPRMVCEHLLGKKHTHKHRISVGVIVMLIGVFVAKFHVEMQFIAMAIDGTGYLLHGIGAVPIIDYIVKTSEERQ